MLLSLSARIPSCCHGLPQGKTERRGAGNGRIEIRAEFRTWLCSFLRRDRSWLYKPYNLHGCENVSDLSGDGGGSRRRRSDFSCTEPSDVWLLV